MANSPFSVLRFRIIFSIAWLLLIINHALVLYSFNQPWQAAIIDSLISYGILLLLGLPVMNTLRYYLPRTEQYLNIFVWCILLSAAWLLLTKFVLSLLLGRFEGYKELLHNSLAIRFSIAFLLLGCMSLVSVLWYNWQEQKENEQRKADAEKLAKEAELFKLRQQLQPHFLFNSLNSISALIGSRPEEARKMLHQLSDFLRGTIKKEENQLIPLAEELEYLKLYLEIEKVRFGYRLKTEIQAAENALACKLPSMLAQPLMENAIKFGLYGTTGEVTISLKAEVSENNLVLAITNPYDPDMQLPEGTGFGLKSVKRRLYLLYGRNDLLTTYKTNDAFAVTFKIPLLNV
jgi:hypothetical protein